MNRYDGDRPTYYNRNDPNSPNYRGNGYDNNDPEYYNKMKGSSNRYGSNNDGYG